MKQMKRSWFVIFLVGIFLTGCSSKPYGHYRDDQMIGFIDSLNEQEQTIEFNISEWTKRNEKGPAMDDWGALYKARVLPGTKISNEAGERLGWKDLRNGQKVQINPPNTKKVTDTPDELIILAMTNEELLKRAGLLAGKKGSYRTTVVYENGQQQPFDPAYMEKEASIVFQGGYGWLEYNPNYVIDVKKAFAIKSFPVFLIFDTEKLVLQTDKLETVITFLKPEMVKGKGD